MSISIDKPFSEWKPPPPKERNSWALFAVIAVIGAFGCGVLVGYALRNPRIHIEQLRLDAEKASKNAAEFREIAIKSRDAVKQSLDRFSLGVPRGNAQRHFENTLSEYKVNFKDSTELTLGVQSTTAEIGDYSVTLIGADDGLASIQLVLVGDRNTTLAMDMIYAGFEACQKGWFDELGVAAFNRMLLKVDEKVGCFAIRGRHKVTARVGIYEGAKVLMVTFSPNRFE